MGRCDVKTAIELTKLFGLRISEVCMLKVENLLAAHMICTARSVSYFTVYLYFSR